MEITDIVQRLNQMREAQVVLRQVSISKQDMLQLREAQLNIEAIDRAMADENKMARRKSLDEADRLARETPGIHTLEYDPFEDDSGDSSTL